MNIHQAYVIYNNGIQSVDPQLAEAIDRIIDHKNMQLEKLDRTELAEVKARMEIERLRGVIWEISDDFDLSIMETDKYLAGESNE